MQGHNSYIQPTYEEKLYQIGIFLKKYMQKNSLNFQLIKKNISNIFNEFKKNKGFDKKIEIRKSHFKDIVKIKNTLYLYFYLIEGLFPSIVKLESLVKNIINCNFFQLYYDFNIDLLDIKTDLLFFKSFAINFSISRETDQLNIKR